MGSGHEYLAALTEVSLLGTSEIVALRAGDAYTCVSLLNDRTLCWGEDSRGVPDHSKGQLDYLKNPYRKVFDFFKPTQSTKIIPTQ